MTKSQYPAPEAIRALMRSDARLAVRVTPNARADAIMIDVDSGGIARLHIRVTATPEDGKANAAVIALLAKALGMRKTALRIVKGQSARTKLIALSD
jgi:hypothetical protein